MKRLLVAVILSISAAQAQPILNTNDWRHIEKALDALVMTPSDAGFQKDVGQPVWALAWVTNTLSDPFHLPTVGNAIMAAAQSGQRDAWWKVAAELMDVSLGGDASAVITNRDAINNFANQSREARERFDKAISGLSNADRAYRSAYVLGPMFDTEDDLAARTMLESAGIPRAAQERIEAESRKLDGTDDARAWLAAVSAMDRGMMISAAQYFHDAVMRISTWSEFTNQVKRITTPAGIVFIGTHGDDTYTEAALLIIDPGGNDSYAGDAGTANGLREYPLAAIVDFAGDDVYESKGLVGAGGSLWGVSIVHDHAGNDRYVSDGVAAGAALFGVAWLEDEAGDDVYRGRVHGQGAGSVGFGFLVDAAGDDAYDIGWQGQGFSSVMGWGLLIDRSGRDRYFAGNLQLDHERNDERFLTLSQGFSIGMRPHAGGGVGALVDLSGNDLYTADIYGQGVSYYYSAGFLIDGGGHDRYAMHQYGQGCGIHLSHGLLADLDGNDTYQGYILSQGAAHDYAVGMLFDHAGDDTYTGDHHTQGRALNNAFALLLDRGGADGYFARQRDGGQGIGNGGGFRDFGSLALMLDLDGADIYSGGFSNGAVTLRPLYGVLYDAEEADDD